MVGKRKCSSRVKVRNISKHFNNYIFNCTCIISIGANIPTVQLILENDNISAKLQSYQGAEWILWVCADPDTLFLETTKDWNNISIYVIRQYRLGKIEITMHSNGTLIIEVYIL